MGAVDSFQIMAVLLSHKKMLSPGSIKVVSAKVKSSDVQNSNEETKDKFSLASVCSYFRNLISCNSYSLERKKVQQYKKNPPLPDLVKEVFTKNKESEEKWTPRILSEKKEILLDKHESSPSVLLQSVTNMQLRILL